MPANHTKTPTSKTPTTITARQAQQAYKAVRKEWPTLRQYMPLYIDPTPNPKDYSVKEFAEKLALILVAGVHDEEASERGEI